jgi:hypothetical protein
MAGKTWLLNFRKEHKLQVFEDIMFMKIFRHKRDEGI